MEQTRSTLHLKSSEWLAEKAAWARGRAEEMDRCGNVTLAGILARIAGECDAVLAAHSDEGGAQRDATAGADIPQILQDCLDSFVVLRHGAAGVRV